MKTNHEKCEIAGIGMVKNVKVAVCGMKWTDLCNDTIKITEIHFSYNKEERNENFLLESITQIQKVLKLWWMRCLTFEGKIIVFKTLAISIDFCFAIIDIRSPHRNYKWARKNTKTLFVASLTNN